MTKPSPPPLANLSSTQEIRLLADELHEAQRTGQLVRKASRSIASLSLDEAYQVQAALVERRLQEGMRLAGYKAGCTSAAVQRQFGLGQPIYGRVFEPHVHHGETELNHADFVSCSVEPEFVFRLGCDVTSDLLEQGNIRDAVAHIVPGIEVHHYRFFHGHPTSQELIASNGLHAALIIGDPMAGGTGLDLRAESVSLYVNGDCVASETGAQVQGDPYSSLLWLAQHLLRRGECLMAGQVVIPGSPTALVPVPPGSQVEARFSRLGSVRARFR